MSAFRAAAVVVSLKALQEKKESFDSEEKKSWDRRKGKERKKISH